MRRSLKGLFLVLFLVLLPLLVQAQQGQLDTERIQRAAVFVIQASNVDSDLIVNCVGSGTVVSRGGLILTNAHNTLRSTACPGDTILIAFSVRDGEPPIPKYRAELLQADAGLDLALLSITRQFDGRLIEPGTLALPFVELADSSTAQLDQTIRVVGYPGIGDDPVEIRTGTISGFVVEPGSGDKAWIKTRAEIPGTMSGGGAYDQDGRLIGIPTTAPLGQLSQAATCVPIQDTNRDQLVTESDICIPVGGFINALRPSNFARPLLRAASLGLTIDTPLEPRRLSDTGGAPAFRRLFFAPSVNEAGAPTTVIKSLPAGSNSLYLFFDYENMTPETIYELRVTTDGIPNSTFSLAPVRWSGGEDGLWYIGSSDQPWPNGLYDFTLFIDGITAGNARLLVGGGAALEAAFSDIVFGLLDNRGTPLGNGHVLPTGNIASARFVYRNMQNGIPWTAIWYYNGQELTRTEDTWNEAAASGSKTINLAPDPSLFPGSYRLELYIENSLTATADFVIAGAQQGVFPQIFQNAHFASASSLDEAVTASPLASFPNTIDALYGLFDWNQIAPGTLWTLRMLVDNEPFFQRTAPWLGAETGQNYVVRLQSDAAVPDGAYQMELLVNNVPLQSIGAVVGIGQLPIDRFARASGIQLRGQVIDAETQEGIPGVSLILISEDFSVSEFVWRDDQVYAIATTDSAGRFQLDRPLEFAAPYSIIIAAEGYLPVSADGFEVEPGTPNPLDLTIPLTRD